MNPVKDRKPRFSLSEKLGLGVILFVAVPFAIALMVGVFMYSDAQSRIQHLVDVMMPGQKAVSDLRQSVLYVPLLSRDAVFYLEKGDIEKFNKARALIAEHSNLISASLEKYKAEYAIGGAENHIEVTGKLVKEERLKLAELEQSLRVFLEQTRDPAGRGVPAVLDAVIADSQRLSVILDEHSVTEAGKLYDLAGFYYWILAVLWFGAVAGSAVLVIYFYRRATHPAAELAAIARDIAEGRARAIPEYRHKDEIGELYGAVRYMDSSLRKGMAALERDIQERKRVEAALTARTKELEKEEAHAKTEMENTRKFQEAVENAAEHIIITDADGAILHVNKAAEKITGYSRQEMLGKRPFLWGKQMGKEFYERMWKTIKYDKKTFHGEIMNRRKSGEEYTADLYIAPVLDEKGDVKFFVGIERDITKERAIDRAKTEFVSLASHQLRTPLSAIKWIIEVMTESTPLTKPQKSYLHDIYVSNERLINLVRDLLNVSKIEAGGIQVRPAPTDLHGIIDTAVDLLKHRADAKKVKIRVTCEEEAEAEIDPVLLSEAFRNVLDNAVTFAPPKSVVDINGKTDDGICTIAVHNEGPAISEAERERIFTKFYRGAGAQRLKPEGSGLGLFIAKSAIEAMGGKIWFESGAEKGVTFFIQLPTGKK